MNNNRFLFFSEYTNNSHNVNKTCFSNFYPAQFVDDKGITFHNSEQYLMYHKALLFNDIQIANNILSVKTPSTIKKLGRAVRNFNESKWVECRRQIMGDGLYFKFNQNQDMKNFLLSTGDLILVEASPYDTIWGIGLSETNAMNTSEYQWRGQNLLGKSLMDIRAYFRQNP